MESQQSIRVYYSSILDVVSMTTSSRGEAKRLISQGAVKLYDEDGELSNPKTLDYIILNHQIVKVGKRNWFEVVLDNTFPYLEVKTYDN